MPIAIETLGSWGQHGQSYNESLFSRVESESCMSRVESESMWAGLESESSRLRVQIRVPKSDPSPEVRFESKCVRLESESEVQQNRDSSPSPRTRFPIFEHGWELVVWVGSKIAQSTGELLATAFLRQRISIVIQQGNATSVLGTRRHLIST